MRFVSESFVAGNDRHWTSVDSVPRGDPVKASGVLPAVPTSTSHKNGSAAAVAPEPYLGKLERTAELFRVDPDTGSDSYQSASCFLFDSLYRKSLTNRLRSADGCVSERLHVRARDPAPHHISPIKVCTLPHCLPSRAVLQQSNSRSRNRARILKRNEHPAPIVQQLRCMPVRG